MRKLYALHPDWVYSKYDKEGHYISAKELKILHHLRNDEYIVWNNFIRQTYLGRNKEDYIHLYPRVDGKYNLIEKL